MAFLRFFNDKNRYLDPFSSWWLESDWNIKKTFKPFFTTAYHFNFKQFFSTFASFENKIFFVAVHKSWFIIYMSRHLASVLSLGSLVVQKRLYLFFSISCIINYNPQWRQMRCKWESEFSWDTRVSKLSKLSNLTEHSWGGITTGNSADKIYLWSRGQYHFPCQ